MNKTLCALTLLVLSTAIPSAAFADAFCDTLKSIVASADETPVFESLNTRELGADDQMIASVTLADMPCVVGDTESDGRTFFSCKADATDADARRADLAKQAGVCLGADVTTETASMGDIVSSIDLVRTRKITVAIRWSGSFRSLSINTIAAPK